MKKPDVKQWFSATRSSFGAKRTRVGGYSMVSTLIVVAIVVAVNLFVSAMPSVYTKIDTTPNQLYTLSDQTLQLVGNLRQDVTVYWLVQSGYEDSLLTETLDRYEGLSSHLKIVKRDPVVYPNFASQYTSSQVSNNSLIVESGERNKYIAYSDIYLTDYSNYYYDYSYTEEFDGESALTSAIDYVTNDDLPKVYQLTGHGEATLPSGIQDALSKQNLVLEDLGLLTQESVPEDADILMIYSPERDISEQELDMILAYLQGGGKLMLVTDYQETEQPHLMALMAEYGVSRVDGIVVEGNQNNYLRGYPHYLLPDITSHEITDPLLDSGYLALIPVAQGILTLDGARDGVSVTQLLKTSSSAFSKIAGFDMQTFDKESDDISGPFAVAVAVSEDVDEGQTQVVWFSSSAMLDSSVDQMVAGANQDLFLNAFGWMSQRENSISIHAKSLTSESLLVSDADASLWSAVVVGVIPGVLLLVGILVMVKRRRK